ncbi:response regulator transcription factor [Aerococcaceae bacterium INB8]|uniref:Response regulator transcription factor n=1 Tax=Ruoffia halotolerans TaxID=2748684 RepID=A0A839A9B6_9LACT|nr:response regulator transcription factor [Ruoffia halotolerans]MBA5730115.1 response regulator transcription factor [Ruoffia halotolerans]
MKIIVIDDDAMVTNGIKTIIEMVTQNNDNPYKVVATGKTGEDALTLYPLHNPDIVLLDIRMPIMNGIDAGRTLIKEYPNAKIIYLTTFLEDEYIIEALKIGAKGYLMKTDFDSLIPAIEPVSNGHRVYGDEIVAKIPSFLSSDQKEKGQSQTEHQSLSEQEVELIHWVAQGLNNKEIAEQMHFSEGTIRNYLSNLLEKLELRDRTQLAIYYFKNMGE